MSACGRNPNEVEELLAGRGLLECVCPEDGLAPGQHGWSGSLFAEARRDPHLNLVLHHTAHAWADGYERALLEHGLANDRSHGDRFNDALEVFAKAQADALVSLAQVGRLIGGRAL